MRAAVFHGRGDIRIEDVARPVVAEGELLIQVRAVGICGTDAHEFSHGPAMFPIERRHPETGHLGPMIPGHELAGVVMELGEEVDGFSVGDLVVSGAGISCGVCHWCQRGLTNLCQSYATVGLQRNGGLAEFCSVPASICVRAEPYGLDGDTAALGQPMAIAVHAMRRGRLQSGEVAVVIGVGGIGMFLAYATHELGATVVVADLDEERLSIAGSMGAAVTVNPRQQGLAEALANHGAVPTVIYEVSGSVSGLRTALDVATRGSRIVAVGLQGQPAELELRDLSLREVELIGTNAHVCSTDLPEALRVLASRSEPWSDVAPTALSLDELVSEGIEPLAAGHSKRIKTLVDPSLSVSRPTRMIVPDTR